jgi:hypothetical protein
MTYQDQNRDEIERMEVDPVGREHREVMTEPSPAVVAPRREEPNRVNWGAIVAGLFVAIASELVLSALAIGFGLSTGLNAFGVGIWSVVNIFVALFIGGWILGRVSSPMHKSAAVLNGVVLWGLALVVSAWLVSSGVAGTLGVVASNIGGFVGNVAGEAGEIIDQAQESGVADELEQQAPDINQAEVQARLTQAADIGAATAWGFVIGSLLGLITAMIGTAVGARKPRYNR